MTNTCCIGLCRDKCRGPACCGISPSIASEKSYVSFGSHLFKYSALCIVLCNSPTHSTTGSQAGPERQESTIRFLFTSSRFPVQPIHRHRSLFIRCTNDLSIIVESCTIVTATKTSIISQGEDSCNFLRREPEDTSEHTGPKTKRPVGLGKHSPKQRKKTDQQGNDNENEPATCASSDESWQAHQGPSSE